MIQSKNQQFLSSQPALALYLNRLLQSTKEIEVKIKQQKQKAQELLFNVSTLFGIPTSRNKIEEQMIKIGVIIPIAQNEVCELNEIIKKINTKNTENIAQDTIRENSSFKRSLYTKDDQEGLIPEKKRHMQVKSENKQKNYELLKKQSSHSSNPSSKSNIDKINESAQN